MLKIGQMNTLTVLDHYPFGYQLGGDDEPVVLPLEESETPLEKGVTVEVFVYPSPDGGLVASLRKPLAMVDEFAEMQVKSVTELGAFVDWGLAKDLLIPRQEMDFRLDEGMSYMVYVFYDERRNKLAGSTRLRRFLQEQNDWFQPRQPVSLIIYAHTDMGAKAIINDTHLGLIFKDEIIQPLHIGQRVEGYIKGIRDDGKIDLCFQFHDAQARTSLSDQIIEDLIAHGGFSTLTDKSPADEITQRFGVSKGAYKKALGLLYKQRKITLEKTKITLLDNTSTQQEK